VEHIRRAKEKGIRITAEVTPHHLALTDAALQSYDTHFKVDPPLRTKEHITALIEGLRDGTIDVIASDHQPFAEEKKQDELDIAPAGVVGLETLLPICVKTLIEPGHLTWSKLIAKLTINPANILGIQKGTLKTGADADITIIDPTNAWRIDPTKFRSKGRNTPFAGWEVKGRAHTVIVAGKVRHHV
jgi:dihydroorotase